MSTSKATTRQNGTKEKPTKRVVYKHVVETPYASEKDWPKIDEAPAAEIVADFCLLLNPIGEHRRSMATVPHRTKRRKITPVKPVPVKSDELLNRERSFRYGLSTCTRALQEMVSRTRTDTAITADRGYGSKDGIAKIKVLFVCKDDLSSEILYGHFPTLCALVSQTDPSIRLVPLPKGAEVALGQALALPRVGCVAIVEDQMELVRKLILKVEDLVPMPTSQLLSAVGEYEGVSTKTLISSAPIVPKAGAKATAPSDCKNGPDAKGSGC